MTHLLYVSPQFPSISLVFEQNEALGIRASGTDMFVLSCRRPAGTDRHELHGFASELLTVTHYVNYRDALGGLVKAVAKRGGALLRVLSYVIRSIRNPVMVPKVMAATVLALSWYQRFEGRDRYHVHADFGQNSATAALLLATLLDAPFSFKVHAFDIFSTKRRHRDPLRALKARKAAVIFSEHDYGRQVLERTLAASRGKIVVNYSSVRCEEFRPLAGGEGSRRFVALGRLVPKKGFDVLVAAAARLRRIDPRFTVAVYGGGPEEPRLRSLIAELGLGDIVTLQGTYDNSELPDMLRDCVAVVVPSVVDPMGDMDGIPTVVYEAMALGRAVIASSLSGIPEVVRDGETGLLVPSGDAEALALAMGSLLDEPARALQMGLSGRRIVEERHDHRRAAEELLRSLQPQRDVAAAHGSALDV